MIRITVELVPGGIEERKRVLGIARIWNTMTGTTTKGNYRFEIFAPTGRKVRTGGIVGFPRRSQNVWRLIKRMLDSWK